MCTTTVKSNKYEHEVRFIPKMHELVLKFHYARDKQHSKSLKSITTRIESNRYQDNTLGQRLIGIAISVAPQASQETLQSATRLLNATFYSITDIPVNLSKVAESYPSMDTLKISFRV